MLPLASRLNAMKQLPFPGMPASSPEECSLPTDCVDTRHDAWAECHKMRRLGRFIRLSLGGGICQCAEGHDFVLRDLASGSENPKANDEAIGVCRDAKHFATCEADSDCAESLNFLRCLEDGSTSGEVDESHPLALPKRKRCQCMKGMTMDRSIGAISHGDQPMLEVCKEQGVTIDYDLITELSQRTDKHNLKKNVLNLGRGLAYIGKECEPEFGDTQCSRKATNLRCFPTGRMDERTLRPSYACDCPSMNVFEVLPHPLRQMEPLGLCIADPAARVRPKAKLGLPRVLNTVACTIFLSRTLQDSESGLQVEFPISDSCGPLDTRTSEGDRRYHVVCRVDDESPDTAVSARQAFTCGRPTPEQLRMIKYR